MNKFFIVTLALFALITLSQASFHCADSDRQVAECPEAVAGQTVCGFFSRASGCIDYPCAEEYPSLCLACRNRWVDRVVEGKCPRSPIDHRPSIATNEDGN